MNPDISDERIAVAKIEQAICDNDFGRACFEAGKFIENAANKIHQDVTGLQAKNAKEAIDFLIYRMLISRPLGFKLHVARELRNAEAHKLPYQITLNDMATAVDAVNRLIEWLHQGELTRKWQSITTNFEDAVEAYLDPSLKHRDFGILHMQNAMARAVVLKLSSLGLYSEREGEKFFSLVERLVENGVNVRSQAWGHLVKMRNHLVHRMDEAFAYDLTEEEIEELRKVLDRLTPLPAGLENGLDYPQVKFQIDSHT